LEGNSSILPEMHTVVGPMATSGPEELVSAPLVWLRRAGARLGFISWPPDSARESHVTRDGAGGGSQGLRP